MQCCHVLGAFKVPLPLGYASLQRLQCTSESGKDCFDFGEQQDMDFSSACPLDRQTYRIRDSERSKMLTCPQPAL